LYTFAQTYVTLFQWALFCTFTLRPFSDYTFVIEREASQFIERPAIAPIGAESEKRVNKSNLKIKDQTTK